MKSTPLSFIDLFCGCGGFTLGMLRAGFQCKAAIDFHPPAVAALKANLADRRPPGASKVELALEKDLTQFPPAELAKLIGTQQLDVIVGGPPCQGFSTARQRDGSNHGTTRLKEDPRRHLFRNFLDYVEYFQPKVFVIENVLGIRTAAGGHYFTAVQHEARILGQAKGRPGYRVHGQMEKAEELGVPQKRRRQLIIGVRADLPGYFPTGLKAASRAMPGTMLGDAILDLPTLEAGEGVNVRAYDLRRREVQFLNGRDDVFRRNYLNNVAEVQHAEVLTNHVARPHSARDLRDFLLLPEGTSSAELMRQGVKFEFPYDKTTFKDRYTRQDRHELCSTIVAHLGKDGLMFIHPTQNRSLTPREAARVQSFPDWFVFPEARTHSFRMIGNAVPPLIGEAVGLAVRDFLHREVAQPKKSARDPQCATAARAHTIPSDMNEARDRLEVLMRLPERELHQLPVADFIRGWHALLWLFPGLHPDNALDHGRERLDWPEATRVLPTLPPDDRQYFPRSGWPCSLVLIGKEAWCRFNAKEIADDDFYCAEVQHARLAAARTAPLTISSR